MISWCHFFWSKTIKLKAILLGVGKTMSLLYARFRRIFIAIKQTNSGK
jgi:hypothetical protein